MKISPHLLFAASFAMAIAQPAIADDDDDERRYGGHRKHQQKYYEGNCQVERKWKKNGDFEEKRKCKGIAQPVVVHAAPTVVYPPWMVVQQGQAVYAPRAVPVVPETGVMRCQSQAVGRVLGGVVGGVLGNQIGDGSGRMLATVGGVVAGVLVGGEIGRRVGVHDHACVGQVLEFAPAGRRVQWVSEGQQYAVVPGQIVTGSPECRTYTFEQQTPYGWKRTTETACRRQDGVWMAG